MGEAELARPGHGGEGLRGPQATGRAENEDPERQAGTNPLGPLAEGTGLSVGSAILCPPGKPVRRPEEPGMEGLDGSRPWVAPPAQARV